MQSDLIAAEREAKMPKAIVLLLAWLLHQPVWAEKTLLFYSEAGQRPFSYEENGLPKGLYIDSLQRILKTLPAYRVEIRFAPWARALEEVKSGNAAAIVGVYHRPDERPFLLHSKPIFAEEVAVHCNRDAVAGRQFSQYPEDFAGLRFGNQRAYLAPGPRFFEMARAGQLTLVEGIEFHDLVKKMLVGEIDCVVNPSIVINEALVTLEARGLPERMRAKSKRIMTVKTESVHLGFSRKYEEKHPELARFRELFDQGLSR